jgi:hypothetical protein
MYAKKIKFGIYLLKFNFAKLWFDIHINRLWFNIHTNSHFDKSTTRYITKCMYESSWFLYMCALMVEDKMV